MSVQCTERLCSPQKSYVETLTPKDFWGRFALVESLLFVLVSLAPFTCMMNLKFIHRLGLL
jgi:hypothetical protein